MLKFAMDNGIIDVNLLSDQVEMRKKENVLCQHNHKIWQGDNGYWYTYLDDSRKGRRLLRKKTRKELEELIYKNYQVNTIGEVFDKWVEKKLEYGEIQRQTYDRYKTDFETLFVKTGFYATKMQNLTEEMLEDFIKKSIADFGMSYKRYSNMRTLIIGILKYAKKRGYTDISAKDFFGDYLELSRKAFKKKVVKDEDSVFNKEEIEMLSKELWDNHSLVDLGILLTFQTGLRVGELVALQYSDVNGSLLEVWKTEERYKDADGNFVFEIRESPKTEAGNRTIILDDEAKKILAAIRKQNPFGEYMFMDRGKRMISKRFTLRLIRLCKKLGIPPRSMHKIRKTYATRLINGGVDERLIIKQMGHTNFNCTRDYYYYSDKTLDEAQDQITKALSV